MHKWGSTTLRAYVISFFCFSYGYCSCVSSYIHNSVLRVQPSEGGLGFSGCSMLGSPMWNPKQTYTHTTHTKHKSDQTKPKATKPETNYIYIYIYIVFFMYCCFCISFCKVRKTQPRQEDPACGYSKSTDELM